MTPTPTKLVPPVAVIAAVLVAVFGPTVRGVDVHTIAIYLALVFGGVTAVVHTPTVKKLVKTIPAPRRPRSTGLLTCWDAVTIENVPRSIGLFLAYVDGFFANFTPARARFTSARILTIATSANYPDVVDFYDVESGDLTPAQTPRVVRHQLELGNKRPGLYANRFTWPLIIAALRADGINPTIVKKIIADPTGHPHIPPGFDACQYLFAGRFDKTLFHAAALQ